MVRSHAYHSARSRLKNLDLEILPLSYCRPKDIFLHANLNNKMMAETLQVSPENLGVVQGLTSPPGTVEECSTLLERNHETFHMFFRDIAGMNHISHSLLTCLGLGANPQELRDRYQDEAVAQRPMPPFDKDLLERLNDPDIFYDHICDKTQYHTMLKFFERKIAADGWKKVVHEYVFSKSKIAERMLASMFDGLYHPLIHLGLAVEFQLPGLVAEALAQAACNDDSHLDQLFARCEEAASNEKPAAGPERSLLDLVREIRASDKIRNAPQWSDLGLKLRAGLVGRACKDFAQVAGRFTIPLDEKTLQRRTAEMISVSAYMAGAAQQHGRKTKIDFFLMHSVTSSIFASVLIGQKDWVSLEDRVRLVEWKGRADLAWYAVSGSPELWAGFITKYEGGQKSWEELFSAVVKEHDDGHAAKFIRALKNGEIVSREFECGDWARSFPVQGNMWLKTANMCQDTTTSLPIPIKWVMFTGYPEAWKRPDLVSPIGLQ